MRKSHSQHKRAPNFPWVWCTHRCVCVLCVCGRHLHMIWLGAQNYRDPMLRSLVNLLDFYIPTLGTYDLYPLLCVISCRASNELLRVSTQPFPLCPQGAKVICQSDGQLDRGSYTCDRRTGNRKISDTRLVESMELSGIDFLTAMRKKKKVCYHGLPRCLGRLSSFPRQRGRRGDMSCPL